MSNVHHETVFYSGHVQGVGFRYATMEVAREFDVAGYVKNLADGRVQVEAEGSAKEIAAFLAALEERMHGFVRKSERSSENRPSQFSGFTIR
jgi:acylphosphatase